MAELYIEKKLIEEPSNPIKYYNYSYVKDLLKDKYGHKLSLPTIIDRAKKFGFYDKKKKKKAHDKEVLTNYIEELLQQDSPTTSGAHMLLINGILLQHSMTLAERYFMETF